MTCLSGRMRTALWSLAYPLLCATRELHMQAAAWARTCGSSSEASMC